MGALFVHCYVGHLTHILILCSMTTLFVRRPQVQQLEVILLDLVVIAFDCKQLVNIQKLLPAIVRIVHNHFPFLS